MMWIKCAILSFLLMSVSSNELNLLGSSASSTPSILYFDMIQLLKLCFSDGPNPIAVTENLVDVFYDNLNNAVDSPIIVINKDSISKNIQHYYPTHPLYILSVDSIAQLNDLLKLLKSSPMWNMKSQFFVIGNVEKSCKDSAALLKQMWKYELLSSSVVCPKTRNQTMLYTLNPYAHRAPDPWIAVEKTENEWQRGMLYKKSFKNDSEICASLEFDKTRFMDGYPVKIITELNGKEFLREFVFPSLNMNKRVKYHDEFREELKMSDYLTKSEQDIATGLYDNYQDGVNVIPVSLEFSRIIVTQKRSFTFSYREIVYLLDFKTTFTIICTLFMIFLIILMNNRYQAVSAFFDVFRLLLDMGLESPLTRLSMKILFFTATFFIFVFRPSIDSQLFAFLTRPQSYTIETLKDLHDHNYHVFYYLMDHKKLMAEKLWTTDEDMKYLHPQPSYFPDECLELATKNNTVACVFQTNLILKKAVRKNLHISKKFVFLCNTFHWSRKDWALNDRVYERLLNVMESGFGDRAIRNHIRNPLKKKKAQERIYKIEEYDELTDENMYYFYIWFAICQVFGLFVFIIERLFGRFRGY